MRWTGSHKQIFPRPLREETIFVHKTVMATSYGHSSCASTLDHEDSFEFIRVSALNDNDYSRWMENLPNEKQLCPLKDLVIPGSHNSGTFFLDQNMEVGPDESPTIQTMGSVFGKIAKSVIYSWSVTQSMTIYEQLLSGIRYLGSASRVQSRRQTTPYFAWSLRVGN